MKRHMSDGTAMLACSRYFLAYPRPRLTGPSEAKGAGGGLAASTIGGISAEGTSVSGISLGIAFTWGTCVGIMLSDTGSQLSIK